MPLASTCMPGKERSSGGGSRRRETGSRDLASMIITIDQVNAAVNEIVKVFS